MHSMLEATLVTWEGACVCVWLAQSLRSSQGKSKLPFDVLILGRLANES